MTGEIVSVICGTGKPPEIPGLDLLNYAFYGNQANQLSPCAMYQKGFALHNTGADVLIYVHNDVTIHEPGWYDRVMYTMYATGAAVVGLGGAARLGHPDMYKTPYTIQGMARDGYISNQRDWQVHGGREAENRQVAVVDAFFMAVRVDFLQRIGGWPVADLTHHCLDLWLACEAARHDKTTWMVGVDCTHHGGGTSTSPVYQLAPWLQGGDRETDHRAPHKWLYEKYRDVLPLEVK